MDKKCLLILTLILGVGVVGTVGSVVCCLTREGLAWGRSQEWEKLHHHNTIRIWSQNVHVQMEGVE